MRTKDARMDNLDKQENEAATKVASFTPEEVSKEAWSRSRGPKEYMKDKRNHSVVFGEKSEI